MTGLLKFLTIIISIFSINCGYAVADILNNNINGTDITANIGLNSSFERIITNIIDARIEIKHNDPQLSN